MQTVVIVLHLLIVLSMIGLVLLQRSEGGALGMGGGGGGGGGAGGFLSSRGSSNLLTKATAGLAAAFFVTSLTLSVIAGFGRSETSIIQTQPLAPAGDILDQIRPKGPTAPQVPQSQ